MERLLPSQEPSRPLKSAEKSREDPRILGIRHFSPACARMVRRVILSMRPRAILVEGPLDYNDRIEELSYEHRLPVALYGFDRSRPESARLLPLFSFSPEWAALEAGAETGADLFFCDLPLWQRDASLLDIDGVVSKDTQSPPRIEVSGLVDPMLDTLWDDTFEAGFPDEHLEEALLDLGSKLATYRSASQERERLFATCLRAAVDKYGKGSVLLVCGAIHAQRVKETWRASESVWPTIDDPRMESGEAGTFLIPYSDKRLFSEGMSAIPSPAYYRTLHTLGPLKAADHMLMLVAKRLRSENLHVSSAHLISARQAAFNLAAVRGHRWVSRRDLLDGLASGLLQHELSHPLVWSCRDEQITTQTTPADHTVKLILDVFRGDHIGSVAKKTKKPPLVAQVYENLEALGLGVNKGSREVDLDLCDEQDLARSRFLHRLRVLGVPGFQRNIGPDKPSDSEIHERWVLFDSRSMDGALSEAAVYGASVEEAAQGKLASRLLQQGLGGAVETLVDSVFCNAQLSGKNALSAISQSALQAPRLEILGKALESLLPLKNDKTIFGMSDSKLLSAAISSSFGRGLWLYEGQRGSTRSVDLAEIEAAVSLRDASRFMPDEIEGYKSILRRYTKEPKAVPSLRGAALGALFSEDSFASEKELHNTFSGALSSLDGPEALGDFLFGLFALAREAVLSNPELLSSLSKSIEHLSEEQFLEAAPALRQAFSFFPPLEKKMLGQLLRMSQLAQAAQKGKTPGDQIASSKSRPKDMAQLERDVSDYAKKWDLDALSEAFTNRMKARSARSQGSQCPGFVSKMPSIPGSNAKAGKSSRDSGEMHTDANMLSRWSMILGPAGGLNQSHAGGSGSIWQARENSLAWLYDCDSSLDLRGIRKGGRARSSMSVPEWISSVHELFPKRTIERIERDAVDNYKIDEIVTNPDVLSNVEPNPSIVAAILRSKSLMSPEVLELARNLVAEVVKGLLEAFKKELDKAAFGRRRRNHSPLACARNFDAKGTIKRNLHHFDHESSRLLIDKPLFFSSQDRTNKWQLIILVDQSGSMVQSLIHSSVIASCFVGVPAIDTRLIVFDTEVVDLSDKLDDPLDMLMGIQLGGGTDIFKALSFASQQIQIPRRSLIIIVSDFFEGRDPVHLIEQVRALSAEGVKILGLAALDERATPAYDRDMARRLVDAGAKVAAMTPDALASWVMEQIR